MTNMDTPAGDEARRPQGRGSPINFGSATLRHVTRGLCQKKAPVDEPLNIPPENVILGNISELFCL